MQQYLSNPFVRFLLIGIPAYAVWYILYTYFIKDGFVDEFMVAQLTDTSTTILDWFGYNILPEDDPDIRTIGIDGGFYVWVGNECDGLSLMALFSIFLVAFPGPWKHKAWFLPTGILLIHLINILRVTALVIIVKTSPDALDFNHNYVFTTLVYGFIFLLWYIWVERFTPYSVRKSKQAKENA